MTVLTLTLPDDAAKGLMGRAAREGKTAEDRAVALLRAQLEAPEGSGSHAGGRKFAMEGAGQGDGTSIADVPGEELLQGFGEQ